MKKKSMSGLKRLDFSKKIIAELSSVLTNKIKGGASEQNDCYQYSLDKGCDSIKAYTKDPRVCNGTN